MASTGVYYIPSGPIPAFAFGVIQDGKGGCKQRLFCFIDIARDTGKRHEPGALEQESTDEQSWHGQGNVRSTELFRGAKR